MEKYKEEIIIPENIKKEISEKWFYLYRWISSDEIKMSIERDFLKILKYIWPALGIISILWYLITSSLYFFLWVILFWIILIISYLLWISIYRSILLVKNCFVIVGDNSLYVWWKVLELDNKEELNKNTKYISKVFEEKLFWTSWLSISKEKFYTEVKDNLFSGFTKIWNKSSSKNLNSWRATLLIILLYLIYVIILSISYFLGVLLLWSFTFVLSFLNKQILKIVWNKPILINNLFIEINESGVKLSERKNDIYDLFQEAIKNEWKDWLLLKINKSLDLVNDELEVSIKSSLKLKKEIKESKYKDILNFTIYNSWLKKQIKEPLVQIKELLSITLDSIKETKKDINIKIKKIKRESLKSALELQKERLENQSDNIEKNILQLDLYLKKL